jgi:hypothetical protein
MQQHSCSAYHSSMRSILSREFTSPIEDSAYPLRHKWVPDVAAYNEPRLAPRAAYPLRQKWVPDVAAYNEPRLTPRAAYPLRQKWVPDVAPYNTDAEYSLR